MTNTLGICFERSMLLRLIQYWLDDKKYPHFRELLHFLVSMKLKGKDEVSFNDCLRFLNSFADANIKPQTFAYHIEKLVRSGFLQRIKRDCYRITEQVIFFKKILSYLDRCEQVASILARSSLQNLPHGLIASLDSSSIIIHQNQALLFDFIVERLQKARENVKVLTKSTFFHVHSPFTTIIQTLLIRGVQVSVVLTKPPSVDEEQEIEKLEKRGIFIYRCHSRDVSVVPYFGSAAAVSMPSVVFIIIDDQVSYFSFLLTNLEIPCDYIFETRDEQIISYLKEIFDTCIP